MRLAALVLALGLTLAAPAAGRFPPGPAPTFPRDDPDPAIANGSAQRKLDTARRRWRRARIHNYRFEVSRICFCAPGGPTVIFVRDDRPVAAPASLREVATVRRLHRRIQAAIGAEVHDLSVAYDGHGVPRRIGIDGHAMVADDEVGYQVDHFWRGTKGRGGPDEPTG